MSNLTGLGVSGQTHDFYVYNDAGQIWNGAAFVAWSDADYASYRIAAAEQGTTGRFIGVQPSGATAYLLRLRGASLASSPVVWEDKVRATDYAKEATLTDGIDAITGKTDLIGTDSVASKADVQPNITVNVDGGFTSEDSTRLERIDTALIIPGYTGPIIAFPAPADPDLVNVYVTLTKGWQIALSETVTAKADQPAPVFLDSGLDVSREVRATVEDVNGHAIAVLQLPKASALVAREYTDTVTVSAPGNPPIKIRVADTSGTLESMKV